MTNSIFKDFAVFNELNLVKNNVSILGSLPFKSNIKVWWICSKNSNHEWFSSIRSRCFNGVGCAVCSGLQVFTGENDIETIYPELTKEWDFVANALLPSQVTVRYSKPVFLVCDKGHSYETSIHDRVFRNRGCPYCANKKVLVGFNDLATHYPEIAFQWHPTKNGELTPEMFTLGSDKKTWWIGECGHEFYSSIYKRTFEKQNCSVCAGKRILLGFNDLTSQSPIIAGEWNSTKNGDLKPTQVHFLSHKKAWWICDKEHEWEAGIRNRTVNFNGCPYCKNKKILVGFNDLATTHPEFALEWNPILNGNLLPEQVVAGSPEKVFWRCKKGHEWKVGISNRTRAKSGCPSCYGETFVSRMETDVANFIETIYEGNIVTSNRSILKGQELDIFLPELNVAVEFNGVFWHSDANGKDKNYHLCKFEDCKKLGIELIQVWEDDWVLKSEVVKQQLLQIIVGGTYLNNGVVETISVSAAETFLNKNCLQKFVIGEKFFGVFDETKKLSAVFGVDILADEIFVKIFGFSNVDNANCLGMFADFISINFINKKLTFAVDNSLPFTSLFSSQGFSVDDIIPPYGFGVINNVRVVGKGKANIIVWDAGKSLWVR